MIGDPEFFDVDTKKAMGLWPDISSTSRGIIPYINRMREDKIRVTFVGSMTEKGETIRDILDSCPKVSRIFVSDPYGYTENDTNQRYKELFDKNTSMYKDKIRFKSDRESNVVCIDSSTCTSDILNLYYPLVKPGGIFCGNGHDTNAVKDELSKFRRKVKIGTPIQVSNRTVWFWYKR